MTLLGKFANLFKGGYIMIRKKLAQSELEIMNLFWESKEEQCKKDILDSLKGKGKSASTISFFLSSLTKKGFLMPRRAGRNFFYKPAISKLEYERIVINETLNRTYGQSLEMILANFCGKNTVAQKDIDNIREWLSNLEKTLDDDWYGILLNYITQTSHI